ncbi:hypothetical protein JRQ81_007424, partial [Phrynocephalus forsythii]
PLITEVSQGWGTPAWEVASALFSGQHSILLLVAHLLRCSAGFPLIPDQLELLLIWGESFIPFRITQASQRLAHSALNIGGHVLSCPYCSIRPQLLHSKLEGVLVHEKDPPPTILSAIMSPAGIMRRLYGCWASICSSDFEASLVCDSTLITFFAALHISKLVPRAKADQAGMVLVSDGSTITLHRSKIEKKGTGQVMFLKHCGELPLFLVRAVMDYLGHRGDTAGFLFCHQNGPPLTTFQFWKVTSVTLERARARGLKFATHSFRIGATSTAATMGYDPTRIPSELPPRCSQVILLGQSFIFWAAAYARDSSLGKKLEWRGTRGMHWEMFLQAASNALSAVPSEFLIVLLGGNDLPQLPGKALIQQIAADLLFSRHTFPFVTIIWSEILPRL